MPTNTRDISTIANITPGTVVYGKLYPSMDIADDSYLVGIVCEGETAEELKRQLTSGLNVAWNSPDTMRQVFGFTYDYGSLARRGPYASKDIFVAEPKHTPDQQLGGRKLVYAEAPVPECQRAAEIFACAIEDCLKSAKQE